MLSLGRRQIFLLFEPTFQFINLQEMHNQLHSNSVSYLATRRVMMVFIVVYSVTDRQACSIIINREKSCNVPQKNKEVRRGEKRRKKLLNLLQTHMMIFIKIFDDKCVYVTGITWLLCALSSLHLVVVVYTTLFLAIYESHKSPWYFISLYNAQWVFIKVVNFAYLSLGE